MSTLLFAQHAGPVPGHNEVRSTVTLVDPEAPSATMDHAPTWNETFTDPDTEGGLTSRQVSSYVIPQQKPSTALLPAANAVHNAIVNDAISQQGTAAQRESEGQWGHASLLINEGIEPTINDGHAFGDNYFDSGARGGNQQAGHFMTPSNPTDPATLAAVQRTGNENTQKARSPYVAWYADRVGG